MIHSLVILFCLYLPLGASPLLLNYTGSIAGTDTSATVIFSICPDANYSEALWTETHSVTIAGNRFSVLLGSITPLPSDLFRADTRYLSVSVDGTVLSPRQQIVSVAYAIEAANARNVDRHDITPLSVTLANGSATWDSTGQVTTPIVRTDSLVAGNTPIVDSQGNWIGPTQSGSDGLTLRTFTTTTVDEEEVFFFRSKWLPFPQFDTFVEVENDGMLDISFVGQIQCTNSFNTRINLKQVSPSNQFLGQFGNTSGGEGTTGTHGSAVKNQAIIGVTAGTYRVFIEHQSISTIEGTLKSGSLIVRHYD